jgi:hypothetical protein
MSRQLHILAALPVTKSPIPSELHPTFVNLQHGTCFTSPFWPPTISRCLPHFSEIRTLLLYRYSMLNKVHCSWADMVIQNSFHSLPSPAGSYRTCTHVRRTCPLIRCFRCFSMLHANSQVSLDKDCSP